MKLRVVFAGTPAFALPSLRALAAAHDVVGVLTQPDRPAGRGRTVAPSPVKQLANELGIALWQPERLRGAPQSVLDTLARLREWQPDVIIVVAYGLILPADLLRLPRLGCLNIHASLLPHWRGAAPIQRAIQAGDARSGVSIMQMDEGLDTGDVLREEAVDIDPSMTAGELHDQLAPLGARLIVETLARCAAGAVVPRPQPDTGITYAQKIVREEARLDWAQSAVQIDRNIRAFNPWPGATTLQQGEPLKLLRSHLPAPRAAEVRDVPPGTVLGLCGDALEVVCGTGIVAITELQRAGRRPVSARDFCNAGPRPSGEALLRWQ
jgi:methionyl-tRNA formyltransferase